MPSDHSPPSGSARQPGPATYSRAPKGKACLNCRRRKLKCDCAHPVCSQCVRFGRERDCEYSEKDQKTRTELLEEHIADLKARIIELEGGGGGGSAPPVGTAHSNDYTSWPGLFDDADFADLAITAQPAGHAVSPRSSPELVARNYPIPTYAEAQTLLDAFLPYAQEFGFFLNTARFLSRVSSQLGGVPSVLDGYTPAFEPVDESDPLLAAVFVWGAALCADEDLKARQSAFLARALHQAASSGAGHMRRPHVLHAVQAHVLLANYLYAAGQFADGRRQTADAAALVLAHRLHKIRSPRLHQDRARLGLVHAADAELALRAPADLVEEGERTHAFWQVFVLDKTWAAVLGVPSLLVADGTLGAEIDTPWPLAAEQYRDGDLPLDYGTTGQTLQNFTSTHDIRTAARLSPLGLRARAAALLYRAMWYASVSGADTTARERHAMAFEATDSLLDKFVVSLPSLDTAGAQLPPDVHRHLAVTHCIARLAVVQLHHPFFDGELKSAAKCMSACKAIVAGVEAVPAGVLTHADPLLPVIITVPAQFITAELVNIEAAKVSVPKRPLMLCVSPYVLASHIEEAQELIRRISRDSRLTVLQLEAVNAIKSVLIGTDYQRP
ncbi:C6 transcription factor domain-containing protein [Phanerochaete sordida]|uniref:C6 transcription factor domain-containing protein n=1 Tax=Phanerochaete sordida TaxID=48140 RepID=A0A9P3LDT4_9APHY|nr:C6 transcription factor domain-containing protein [Phanerochaete sordida]